MYGNLFFEEKNFVLLFIQHFTLLFQKFVSFQIGTDFLPKLNLQP